MRRASFVAIAVALVAAPAQAQQEWAYRARLAAETTATSASSSGLFVGTGDSSWTDGHRLRVGGGLIFTGRDGGALDLTARELFARVSATSWMDVEAGKRLLRWGVGYGFAPTGVLDPPRVATDPTDRLGRNEGVTLARGDMFRGDSSLTLAVTGDRQFATRARTVVRGVELALVARSGPRERPSWGANVTHVVGQRLEWHAEVLSHGRISAVAGLQYTVRSGANVVLEYHRDGRGAESRDSIFMRLVRSTGELRLAPELIAIASLDDGRWTIVPGVTWTPRERVQLYVRGTWSRSFTGGAAVRF